jgi:hypothetical protein
MRFALMSGSILIVAASIAPCSAQQASGQGATPAFPPSLYQMNDVAKSLNLSNQQMTQLNDMTTKLQTRLSSDYSKASQLPVNDRASQIQLLNQQYDSEWMKGAGDIFNQDQWKRYRQLNLQYGGFNSLSNPDVQQSLNLTAEQKKNLAGQIDWSTQQLQNMNQIGATNADKASQMYQAYQKEFQNRWNTYLTPTQQQAWGALVGQPFQFQPTFGTPKR